MGFIRTLCEEKGITLETFSSICDLNPVMVSDMDVGLINHKTGKYYHKIKEYFNLDPLLFIKFIYERDNKLAAWRDGLTDEINSTDETRNAFIAKCMEGDDFHQWISLSCDSSRSKECIENA